MARSRMAWKVFGIVSSLGLIIAGFVAKLVFQETEISKALIVFGVFSLVMDMCVIAIVTLRKNKQAKTQTASLSISTLETFADAVINDPAILSKTHSYPLNQQAHGFRKYGEYRIFLNGSPAGLLSKNNPQMMIRTKKVKNVLCAVDNSSGEKDFLFFEVVRAPERKIGFTLLGKLVCVDEKKAGITILQPV